MAKGKRSLEEEAKRAAVEAMADASMVKKQERYPYPEEQQMGIGPPEQSLRLPKGELGWDKPEELPPITRGEMPLSPGDVTKGGKIVYDLLKSGFGGRVKALFSNEVVAKEISRIAPSAKISGGALEVGPEHDKSLMQLLTKEDPSLSPGHGRLPTMDKTHARTQEQDRVVAERYANRYTSHSPLRANSRDAISMKESSGPLSNPRTGQLSEARRPDQSKLDMVKRNPPPLSPAEEFKLKEAWETRYKQDLQFLRSADHYGNRQGIKEAEDEMLRRKWPPGLKEKVEDMIYTGKGRS